MTYETWQPLFIGMVVSILLLNVVQWVTFRERIYGLYTLYMLAWLMYFVFRVPEIRDLLGLTSTDWNFARVCAPMLAYLVYFSFTDAFIGLQKRLPGLYRLLHYARLCIIAYCLLQFWICYLAEGTYPRTYNIAHDVIRVAMIGLAVYAIYKIIKLNDVIARYFVVGSAFLLLGATLAMILTFLDAGSDDIVYFWQAPITPMQIGIILELICFSLGLGYRQRQAAIRTAVLEQKIERQQEKHERKQLEAELAVQQLRQEMSEVQMRALQSQLNPHFLFNSLNSLSSLIVDEPAKAEQFVDEMASVYRYILQTHDFELTTLSRELNFIHSYLHLLQTRYGRGITYTIEVAADFLNDQLPPLTLQLLIENAVKHNIVSSDEPLKIYISTTEYGWLIVRNNLQRKSIDRVKSTKKGLLNILTKYKMLGQPTPTVQETADEFIVTLPLIR
ncbi:7TM protein involved in diverse intracellular signaling [Larkinella arboricola]|uniref:7TM protein involved in diverse intracellular signaling n=1 Tax=Larkinella arboricola TaxID=643671 RepID=A0A327X1W0_LARAB|nr:histidine kinase [Larkinella arboricola]RAK00368.1 7TM protein involved in diverse intracellular signaling [Larkinella arboricola]